MFGLVIKLDEQVYLGKYNDEYIIEDFSGITDNDDVYESLDENQMMFVEVEEEDEKVSITDIQRITLNVAVDVILDENAMEELSNDIYKSMRSSFN